MLEKLFPSINIHIVVVADELIDELQPYKENLKLFKPIYNVETSFVAQNIRYFIPYYSKKQKEESLLRIWIYSMNTSYYVEPSRIYPMTNLFAIVL